MGDTANPEIAETVLAIGDARIFGLRARPARPRATVIALHGGGYDANYWHHPGVPGNSLLACGAALGFDVLALDRPGNARSRESAPDGASLADQIDMLYALIEREVPADLPVFLIGHSLGGITALKMAADPRAARLSGVETQGVPIRFDEAGMAMLRDGVAALRAAGATFGPVPPRAQLEAMFYGPAGRYDPKVVARDDAGHGAPVIEVEEVITWIGQMDAILPRIAIPLHWTFARHEASSLFDGESQPRLARLLAGNPLARFAVQEDAAHNISLHHVGRAYHLKVLAFFEEVLALNHRAG